MDKNILFQEDQKELKLSQSEVYFEWWLEELKACGLVSSYTRGKPFELFPPLAFAYIQNYKTKLPLVKNANVLRNIIYTPDYTVLFNEKLVGKLFGLVDNKFIQEVGRELAPGNIWQEILFLTSDKEGNAEYRLHFDVKPPAQAVRFSGALGSSRDFPIKQRLMFEKYGIFVNKVIPYGQKESLFKKTFMPKRYKWTDGSTKLRTLKEYEKNLKSLPEYLESKNIIL